MESASHAFSVVMQNPGVLEQFRGPTTDTSSSPGEGPVSASKYSHELGGLLHFFEGSFDDT